MYKTKYLFMIIICIILLTSCSSFNSSFWLNEDGSGRSSIRFDLGQMARDMQAAYKQMDSEQNENGSELIEENATEENLSKEMYEEPETEMIESENTSESEILHVDESQYADDVEMEENELIKKGDQIFKELMKRPKLDTVILFGSMFGVIAKSKLDKPDDLDKFRLKMEIDSAIGKNLIDLSLDFDHIDNIRKLSSKLNDAIYYETKDSATSMKFKDFLEAFNGYSFDKQSKKLAISGTVLFEEGEMSSEDMDMFQNMDDNMDGLLSLLGLNDVKSMHYMPGEILKIEGEVAHKLIDKNTVEISILMKNCIKKNFVPGYTIYYK